ncbi:exodeoxyribonuclease V subunit alpha [Pseudofrancisella aestuarii]|uniref:RecBCD enzyme subunit RecD n=1 Tax=Pseudofrancisella aestuarii TaxID=2670347 RepID=A0ABV9TCK0_9GAMM|nr:exodeoxyribonuclease V subunit alpha [Pseudofrancisella aestuarii]
MYRNLLECKNNLADIEPIDFFFAKETSNFFKLTYQNSKSLLFHLLVALMSSYREGHSCLDIKSIANKILWQQIQDDDLERIEGYSFPSESEIENLLKILDFKNSPIHYAFGCLYIKRIRQFENEIAAFLKEKIKANLDYVDIDKFTKTLNKLFPIENESKDYQDWQEIAVINSLVREFSIISGGPGTGKTTTVTKLLLAFQMLNGSDQKIALLAPTGKAAQRLTESILNTKLKLKENLSLEEDLYDLIPEEASTIHRFLGIVPNSKRLKYSDDFRAPFNVVVIDEASMLDINIFIKLIRVLRDDTKLILIGDINQLPSVEVGSILSNLTEGVSNNIFSNKVAKLIQQTCNEEVGSGSNFDYVTKLEKNYRSNKTINNLANKVLVGDPSQELDESISFYNLSRLDEYLNSFVKAYYKELYKKKTPQEALEYLKKFRILVANKELNVGTVNLNDKIAKILGKNNKDIYHGKPIMIVENSYSQNLFNGDVGVIWNDRTYFENKDVSFTINTLPKFETVYAMTIHKTQGSEFERVCIILPNESNRALSRELLYTGITRAKDNLDIISNKDVWTRAISNRSYKSSHVLKIIENKLAMNNH